MEKKFSLKHLEIFLKLGAYEFAKNDNIQFVLYKVSSFEYICYFHFKKQIPQNFDIISVLVKLFRLKER